MNVREEGERTRNGFLDGKVGNERKTVILPFSPVTPTPNPVILGACWGEHGKKVFFPGLNIGPLLQGLQITVKLGHCWQVSLLSLWSQQYRFK